MANANTAMTINTESEVPSTWLLKWDRADTGSDAGVIATAEGVSATAHPRSDGDSSNACWVSSNRPKANGRARELARDPPTSRSHLGPPSTRLVMADDPRPYTSTRLGPQESYAQKPALRSRRDRSCSTPTPPDVWIPWHTNGLTEVASLRVPSLRGGV